MFLLLASGLLSAPQTRADERARLIVADMERALSQMGAYSVKFTVKSGDLRSEGEYAVSGGDFYMSMDGVEIYTEGGVRRQVIAAGREIAVDTVDMAAKDFISNPTQGLSVLFETFDAVSEANADGSCVMTLSPRADVSGGLPYDNIMVYTDTAAKYPERIVYLSDAGGIEIHLGRPTPLKGDIPRFSAEKYPGFEVIDYR